MHSSFEGSSTTAFTPCEFAGSVRIFWIVGMAYATVLSGIGSRLQQDILSG